MHFLPKPARQALLALILVALASPSFGLPSVAAGQAAPAQSPAKTPAFDRLAAERDVLAIMAKQRIPGVQVIVLTREGVAWRKALGLADLETKRPMTLDTLLQIGSVTKVFTASLVADLVARGELSWGDTLGELLPDMKLRRDVARISLADLASHQSRLPANPPNRVDVEGVWQPYGRAELHSALVDPRLELVKDEPNYSNFGFAVLGHIVERRSGKPLEQLLRERIFAPLGMADSRIGLSARDAARLAVHYWPEDTPLKPRPHWTFGQIAGFGGIASTADDVAKFLRFQMDPKAKPAVLDPEAMLEMRTVRAIFPHWRIGFGRPWVERREADGTLLIEHGGEVDGHSALIAFSPARSVGVVVLANLGQSAADDVARPLLARMLAVARGRPVSAEAATHFFQTREWSDAESAYGFLVSSKPGDADAWFRLGRARYEMRDLAGALEALERAAALPAASGHIHYYLAATAAAQGRDDDAVALLKKGLSAGTIGLGDLEAPEFRTLRSHPAWQDAAEATRPSP